MIKTLDYKGVEQSRRLSGPLQQDDAMTQI